MKLVFERRPYRAGRKSNFQARIVGYPGRIDFMMRDETTITWNTIGFACERLMVAAGRKALGLKGGANAV